MSNQPNLEVIILRGLSGSGKTTWAKQQVEDNPGKYKIICKDDLRRMLDNDKHSAKREEFILVARDTLIQACLMQNYSVIIADTNLNPKHEEAIRTLVENFKKEWEKKVEIKIQSFLHVPMETCIEQDLKRQHPVGEKVIKQQFRQWVEPVAIKEKIKAIQNPDLPHAILVDIDGTVALRCERGPFEYDKVKFDLPNKPVIDIVDKFAKTHEIIFMSGRDDSCKNDTVDWIKTHIPSFKNSLVHIFMRAGGDRRKDSIIKKEIFDTRIKSDWYVDFVLDDRQQVVDMWRTEVGLTCLQVDYGNF